MQILNTNNGIVLYKETEYNLGIYEPIDDNSISIQLYNNQNDNLFCFLINETIINDSICTNMQDFIDTLISS
jgi:hypothetical protein